MNADKLNLLLQLIQRLFTKKPDFFKKLQLWVLGLAAVLILIILGNNWLELYDLGPRGEKILSGLWYVVSFLGGAALTAQASTVNAELQDDRTKENVVKSLDGGQIAELKSK